MKQASTKIHKTLLKRLLILLFFISIYQVNAQPLSNKRSRFVSPVCDSILRIDTLSIVPQSFAMYLKNRKVPESCYRLNCIESKLQIYCDSLQIFIQTVDSIELTYRVFPFAFHHRNQWRDTSIIVPEYVDYRDRFSYKGEQTPQTLIENQTLDKQGSISRGITFGNNQDMVVNSDLNLQLSGKITEDFSLVAAISDNNIPIQAEGTSQQLREFDKVFVKLYSDKTELLAGDFEISSPQGYFMKMYKKVQGGSVSYNTDFEKNKLKTTFAGAVSKGKYCRQSWNGQEGNQGPYQLNGCENEKYVVVLAGSEKVYINGQLKTRGQDNDYTIDYNTAEIRFTPNCPITKDSRVIVEFEYTEQNYARFLVFSSNEWKSENYHLWLNVLSEQDAKNQSLRQDLNIQQKMLLSTVGDSLHQAVVSNVDTVDFDADATLYRKTDTLVDGGLYTGVFVYSTNKNKAKYRPGFSFVGKNKGNYRKMKSAANGQAFEWIAPVNGIPQGSYEPVSQLVSPKKKQIITLGGKRVWNKKNTASFEIGLSNYDLNTFSTLHDNDNIGIAGRMKWQRENYSADSSRRSRVWTHYRLVHQNFSAIEDFRDIEFKRNWNIKNRYDGKTENAISLGFLYQEKKHYSAAYQLEYLSRQAVYQGIKNSFSGFYSYRTYKINANASLVNSKDTEHISQFLTHQIEASKHWENIKTGIREYSETNRLISSDSLAGSSFRFNEWELFLENTDSTQNQYSLHYKNRNDFMPLNHKLKRSTQSHEISGKLAWLSNKKHQADVVFTFRNIDVSDTMLIDDEITAYLGNNLTGRVQYRGKFLKKALTTSTIIEMSSGMEPKRNYSYIKVAAGQGVYQWNDYNDNDVKELNEFEPANFSDEADHIRVLIPTDDYVRSYFNQWQQSLMFNPQILWHKNDDWKRFLSKFSNRTAYSLQKKNTERNRFFLLSNDSSLIHIQSVFRNVLAFNRSNPVFSAEVLFQSNKSTTLLTNGLDSKTNRWSGFSVRWNILKTAANHLLIVEYELKNGSKTHRSEYFSNRDFTIDFFDNSVGLKFQKGYDLNLRLSYQFLTNKNLSENAEIAVHHNISFEGSHRAGEKANLRLTCSFINIAYEADERTSLAYTMLNGLNAGKNAIWNISLQKKLNNFLQLNLNYSGRYSETGETVHTGGAQIRAVF